MKSTLRFDYTPDQIIQQGRQLIQERRDIYDQVEQIPLSQVSFDTLLHPLTQIDAYFSNSTTPIVFLANVSPDPHLREAAMLLSQMIDLADAEILSRPNIYHRLKQLQKSASLTHIETNVVEQYLANLGQYNPQLPSKRRQTLLFLNQQKTQLTAEYDRNLNQEDQDPIHGIPYKDTTTTLENCHQPQTRKEIQYWLQTRCSENLPVLEKLHQVRQEIAQILGYPNNAEYKIHSQMLSDRTAILKLLNQIINCLQPACQEYLQKLTALKATHLSSLTSTSATRNKRPRISVQLESYDLMYYHQKYLREHYGINWSEIKKYFPLDYVLEAMLELFGQIFGLEFRSLSRFPKWCRNLKCYSVLDQDKKTLLGYFYLDAYYRDGKSDNVYAYELISGYRNDYKQILPVSVLVCNFSKPDYYLPAFLDLDQIMVLFHEFGHVIHNICSGFNNQYHCTTAVNAENDFREAIAQVKEHWVLNPNILKMLSCHYKTKKPLSMETVQKIIESKHVNWCYEWTIQAIYAKIDLVIQSRKKLNQVEMQEIVHQICQEHSINKPISLSTWEHLGGLEYDGTYYSYLLTQIIAADIYSRFENDPFNQTMGQRYRQSILNQGSIQPGSDMIHNFLENNTISIKPFFTNFLCLSQAPSLRHFTLPI